HAGRRGAVPAGPPRAAGVHRSALLPPQVRRDPDPRGVRRSAAERGGHPRSGKPPARRRRHHHAAGARQPVVAANGGRLVRQRTVARLAWSLWAVVLLETVATVVWSLAAEVSLAGFAFDLVLFL